MKNNILIFSLLLFLFSSCQEKEDTAPQFIQLSHKEINFSYKTGKYTIDIKTNTSWEIENVPEWLTVSKQKGTKEDKGIVILVQANRQNEAREFELIFRISERTESVRIRQDIKPKVEYSLPSLGFGFSELISGTYSETEPFDLEFEANRFFINSLNKKSVFPGSLFAGNLANYPKLDSIDRRGISYIPMTLNLGVGLVHSIEKSFLPSYQNYKEVEQRTIDRFTYVTLSSTPSALSSTSSSGECYYSRRHLHCIGLYELGISLDELLNGKSYKEEPMKHEFGLIYPVSRIRFATIADLPNPTLLTQELAREEFIPLRPNYISTINYGNNILLLVESDFDKEIVNSLKSKLERFETLDAEETLKVEQIDAYYIFLESVGKFDVFKGNLRETIRMFSEPQAIYPTVPVSFSFADYYTNGVGSVKYKIHVD